MQTQIEVIGPAAGEVVNVLGAPIVIKSDSSAGGMFFADHPIPPGYFVPPHVHETEDELFYVLAGELTLIAPEGELVAGPGTFVHLRAGVAHGFANRTDREARMLVITTGESLEGVFRGLDAAGSRGDLEPARIGAICAANGIQMLAA
ncbi:MAG TPA: cupin domain-containing protein [Caulobacteraceae bacterium]|nr:cupin domain-containing protein [Caulobacteraceae bacterium]